MTHLARFSFHLYRLTLRAYPRQFREEYAPHMLQLFGDQCREAGRTGGLLKLWVSVIWDLLLTIPAEHLDCVRPTRNMHGPALMLGGALFSTGLILSNAGPGDMSPAFSLFCLGIANLLLTVGLLGFGARYHDQLRRTGRTLLRFAAIGSLISLAGGLGLAMTGPDWLWGARMLGFILLFLFMSLFGLVCLIRRPLPRWNGIPLLIGVWIPAGGLVGALHHAVTGAWLGAGSPVTAGILAAICLGFLILGNMLRTDPGKAELIRHSS